MCHAFRSLTFLVCLYQRQTHGRPLPEEAQQWNEEEQNHSFADYGQTVRVMNKTDKSNVIENIFLDLLVSNFFLVGGAI